jgi:hypothetical protein
MAKHLILKVILSQSIKYNVHKKYTRSFRVNRRLLSITTKKKKEIIMKKLLIYLYLMWNTN